MTSLLNIYWAMHKVQTELIGQENKHLIYNRKSKKNEI